MDSVLALLMEENLIQVWNENNSSNRIKAIEKIYTSDSSLYHVGHQTTGHSAINKSVSNVLANTPEAFIFLNLSQLLLIII